MVAGLLRRRLLSPQTLPKRPGRVYCRSLASVTKPGAYGQPLFHSHPHLIKQHDLTPGIKADEYEQRRKRLMDSLPKNSLVVSVAAPIKMMSNNIFYKYRQNSDFWYLTGFAEPDSALLLEKDSSPKGYKMTLFCSGKDSAKERWDGPKTSLADAATIFGADVSERIASFASAFKSAVSRASTVYIDLPQKDAQSMRQSSTKSFLRYLSGPARSDIDDALTNVSNFKRKSLASELAPLRAIKSPAEQDLMHEAGTISGRAHAKTMLFSRPGLSESALAAHFEYLCALQGAQRPAYVPVVASGPNALIIHYTDNNHLLQDGELTLMDAGCEYNGYASDITRTFPVSGKFTTAQAELYSAVLTVQRELITDCTEAGGYTLHELHRKSCSRLREELTKLGFNFESKNDSDLERVLYPHFLSHPIGIDLHESFNMSRGNRLKAGMVVTIEPGIYVPPAPQFPKQYHNLGIRIEDEILVGPNDPVILTASAPKEIVDIEGACQGLLGLEPF
ncbi:hypothetical protein AGABI2DRAFT_219147 [Agaricus bisporus var. bisporus H97]|uniref:hypothetical protein n=1 Tax=Agaricus bisporus var. bisporus (strain H97 / ATCC MYA-4626 / FGSC 10389) TaxID=936046 RepID=UPI00029F52DA|nr:hypothetical protein AGABI2DRAFT_219147 [Agaricus bisporus var. bisporus H97]EKV47922.1 hypothetical protein AGABI2DRAFT_219147 [Agaricus bisporus var. bisporus H97]